MRIHLHIGPEQVGAERIQAELAAKRDQLEAKGVLFPKSMGGKNHTRLFMAMSDPDHVDPLRYARGYMTPEKQAGLLAEVTAQLQADVARVRPEVLILSASQFGASLNRPSELKRLHDLLRPLSEDIVVTAHVDEPSALLARAYAAQVMEGRQSPLDAEITLAGSVDWRGDCLALWPEGDPEKGVFGEIEAPPFWLDFKGLQTAWEAEFGAGSVRLRLYDEAVFHGEGLADEMRAAFDLPNIGRTRPVDPAPQPGAAWVTRARQMNVALAALLRTGRIIPRRMWRSIMEAIVVDGPPIDPATLSTIAKTFDKKQPALEKTHGLPKGALKRPRAKGTWEEADPLYGYRPTQYLLAMLPRIDKATKQERKAKGPDLARVAEPDKTPRPAPPPSGLSPAAERLMPPLAVQNFEKLKSSSFKPHNKLGSVNEEDLAAAYTPIMPRQLPEGNSGNVIVGCMKNEAPYIVEWVAYHRAMGVDNFLIYTNDCSDGTSEILDRLQELGVLQHRNNDAWKGNSPQQYALNQSLKEPVIRNAEWIIHIDVDEFMNVRCGNGTLPEFLERVPDATNVAMTWRLFGHSGVTKLSDDFVIDQFDMAAPKFCPKPHTVWGFKTMFKNIGAYEKISCHRPNKLDEGFRDRVKWVNGSGHDMTGEVIDNGWRSSKKSVGYDLLQLNHYALRSAESFLIKRQRGRALHVDRSIGINYWIRMDWSVHRDITIKRNIPRLRAEYDRLMADDVLRGHHETGLAWHRAKAEELHANPEFADLYAQALEVKLTETERVAYALALDMES